MTRAIVGLFGLACLVLLVSSKPVAGQGPVKKIKNSVGMERAEIPTGKFIMGSPPPGKDKQSSGKDAHEAEPAHEVTLTRPFSMGVFEVTQREFATVMGGDNSSHFQGAALLRLLGQKTRSSQYPVEQVDHADAKKFCARLSALPAEKAAGRVYRLPTEAEWERAARGSNGGLYPWGNDTPDCDHAASRACDGGVTVVATHPAGMSPEGVYDMAGNAWEWVSDGYVADFYADSPAQDPEVPVDGAGLSSVRGVDGWSDVTVLRSTNREMVIPDAVSPLVGFRCVSESAR